jgi:hypothetical protein
MSATWCRLFAMRDHGVQIEAVNVGKKYVVFAGGLKVPIVNFLDENYDKTKDLFDACYYEFGSDKFGYGIHRYEHTLDPGWNQ